MIGLIYLKNGETVMKAKINLEKFICSLMKRYYEIHNIDPLTTRCWLDKVLRDQGLEYKDGEIVEILQESEDEKIIKALLEYFAEECDTSTISGIYCYKIYDWLKKQSEKKSIGNIKPKFNAGDWVIDKDDKGVFYTTRIEENFVTIADIDGDEYVHSPDFFEVYFRLWSIQDAKDGDVLHSPSHRLVWIYKDNEHYHASINLNYANVVSFNNEIVVPSDVCPANRVQRSILFQKMEESNYKWDAEKKELKKFIEEKSPAESLGISQEKYEEIVNECIYGEEKSTDKVEPKFHEGEWVVDGCGYVWKIELILNQFYVLEGVEGDLSQPTIEWVDLTFHLWTIKDAKDGDVLVNVGYKRPFIYKGCLDPNHPDSPVAYCGIDSEGYFCRGGDNFDHWWTEEKVQPATKEQRDLLFAKMKESGWEWDDEKKELKKIEPNLSNSPEIGKNDTLLDLLQKMPSCITVDGINYHFVMKKTIAYMAFYEGEGEGSGKAIFWMAGDPITLLTTMLDKLKEEGLLE